MHTRNHLEISEEPLKKWCQRWKVRELALFGSATNDTFSDDSDVDLLVEFQTGAQVTLFTLSRMQREMSALLARSVDLVPKQGLKPRIRDEVLASAQVIYAA
ncbi:MAG: nucleotidyltransferase family protein [Magnetococcales bacterium]|nr:nucleotidyltransferase family protein [Magnetococcales bacterium]MBF0321537.1 nucleotidyltransferase family protein [Magnetococcales bacterium]MBF0321541.1 nucleotidyltransferase family protein [Magnetococcales bacterium]